MNSQPKAPKVPGMTALAVIIGKTRLRPGRSVRSASHAMGTAKNSATKTVTAVKMAVLYRAP